MNKQKYNELASILNREFTIELDRMLLKEQLSLRGAMPKDIQFKMYSPVQLSVFDFLKKPIKVRGLLIKVGKFLNTFYRKEELQKAAHDIRNKIIPIKWEHNEKIKLGEIQSVWWDETQQGLMGEGYIFDKKIATEIQNKNSNVWKLSGTIYHIPKSDKNGEEYGSDLYIDEVSVTLSPRCKDTYIDAV